MSMGYSCTCQTPEPVKLQTGQEESLDINQGGLLLKNLKDFGWSPISITGAPSPCPSHEQIVRLFKCRSNGGDDGKSPRLNHDIDVVYQCAESGSTEGSVEPKESYEVRLSKCGGDSGTSENVIKTWCRTLSWIAQQVCIALEIPPNTLLVDDEHKNSINSNNNVAQESLDLLRVFHYYATPMAQELGSSPHTDWGSLTVIWQDDVGGLQTYCRACHKWVDVKPSCISSTSTSLLSSCSRTSTGQQIERRQTDNHRWECIVHVGDMASLVLDVGNEVASDVANVDCDATNKLTDDTKNLTRTICWPSPKHRVVSSATSERASLVYFGYPPASCSLQSIQDELRDWKPSLRGHRLPLRDYFLLQDQSSNASTGSAAAAATTNPAAAALLSSSSSSTLSQEHRSYSWIRELTIREIVAWKWSQVQRN
jgi:hypothetical protein